MVSFLKEKVKANDDGKKNDLTEDEGLHSKRWGISAKIEPCENMDEIIYYRWELEDLLEVSKDPIHG